jgi:hypothetical protein
MEQSKTINLESKHQPVLLKEVVEALNLEDGQIVVDGTLGLGGYSEAGEARDIIRSIQQKRKELGTTMTQKVIVSLPMWPKSFEEEIKRKALVSSLKVADTFLVETV